MDETIEVGDRFETRDGRDRGRVIRVTELRGDEIKVRTDVHPNNPGAVGLHRWTSANTLQKRYRKISR